jgi:hypothetical protein
VSTTNLAGGAAGVRRGVLALGGERTRCGDVGREVPGDGGRDGAGLIQLNRGCSVESSTPSANARVRVHDRRILEPSH